MKNKFFVVERDNRADGFLHHYGPFSTEKKAEAKIKELAIKHPNRYYSVSR